MPMEQRTDSKSLICEGKFTEQIIVMYYSCFCIYIISCVKKKALQSFTWAYMYINATIICK